MAGRGRGKGKGRGGNTMMQDLMRSNAEDLGIDDRGMGPAREEPPPLWPPIEGGMPALTPMTEMDKRLIDLQRRQLKRIRESPYHMRDATQFTTVMKWSDRNRGGGKHHEALLVEALSSSAKYAPPELISSGGRGMNGSGARGGGPGGKRRARASSLSEKELRALEEKEGLLGGDGERTAREAGDAPAWGDDNEYGEEEGDEFDQDYLENHYDSAGDDDDGDDGDGEGYL